MRHEDVTAALRALTEIPYKLSHYRSPAALEGAFCALARLLYPEKELQRALLRRWPTYGVGLNPDDLGWQCTTQILTAALADLEDHRG